MAVATNTRTGKTESVPDHYIGHPILGIDLIAEGTETQAASNKETKNKKEQPAPLVEVVEVLHKPEINIEEDKE